MLSDMVDDDVNYLLRHDGNARYTDREGPTTTYDLFGVSAATIHTWAELTRQTERQQEKRWHLFAGGVYYPSGGLDDYRGSFDTFEEAADASYGKDYEWAHVAHVTPDGTLIKYWVRGS